MKKILLAVASFLFFAVNAFAADGDLIVDGKIGVGTPAPSAKVDVNGNVKTLGVTRSLVIDHRVYGQVAYQDENRNFIGNGYTDRQYIPLLPDYGIVAVYIPFATNRSSFSFTWELHKHNLYSTDVVIASGTANGSGNGWIYLSFPAYTIESGYRTYFLIKDFTASGGTYTYIYNWEVYYTTPTTL